MNKQLRKTSCSFSFALIIMMAFGPSCHKESNNIYTNVINPNIKLLVDHSISGPVNIQSAVWLSSNEIYTTSPFGLCKLSSELNPISYSVVEYIGGGFIETGPSEKFLLFIRSNYYDATLGALYEYDIDNKKFILLLDSTNNISSAKYYRDEQHIIFYTYGNPIGTNAGYYQFDRTSNEKKLLYSFYREGGPYEFVNGFDIHPINPIILIPVFSFGVSPKIIEFNFLTKVVDTLKVHFNFSYSRSCLWLRYNKNGTKILYCCFPLDAGGFTPADDSEIGIIDRSTLRKRILNVNTNLYRSINICPHWSPDEMNIIYSSGELAISGSRGIYKLYMLTNINVDK